MIIKLISLCSILLSSALFSFQIDGPTNNIEIIKTNIKENDDLNFDGFTSDYTAFKEEGYVLDIPIKGIESSYKTYKLEIEVFQEGLDVIDKNILSTLGDFFTYQDHVIAKNFKKIIPYSYLKKDFSIKIKCINEYLAEFGFTYNVTNRKVNNYYSSGIIKQIKKSYIKGYELLEEVEKLDFTSFTGLFDYEYYYRFNNRKLSFTPKNYFSISEVVVQFLDTNDCFNNVLKTVEGDGNSKYKEYYLIPEYQNGSFTFNNASFYYLDEMTNRISLIKDDKYNKKVSDIYFPFDNYEDFDSLELIFNFVGVGEGEYCFNLKKTLFLSNKLIKDSFSIDKSKTDIDEMVEMEEVNL